jgi:hypothetical protein
MIAECSKPKMVDKYVRIHDAGDFYSLEYLLLWLEIVKACPNVTFYCYTKEVKMFKRGKPKKSSFIYQIYSFQALGTL